jgi:hypothetical protein
VAGGAMKFGEYVIGLIMLSLGGFGLISKLAQWKGVEESRGFTLLLKIIGMTVAVTGVVTAPVIAEYAKGEAPWSHLPAARDQFIDSHWPVPVIKAPSRFINSTPPVVAYALGYRDEQKSFYATSRMKSELKLLFKLSPLFTEQRKARIAEWMGQFYLYLKQIGFDPPSELPPLGTVGASNGGKMHGGVTIHSFGGSIYDEVIIIADGDIDSPELIRRAYSDYAFEDIFGVFTGPNEPGFKFDSAVVYSGYYMCSFANKDLFANRPLSDNVSKWTRALWQIRSAHGKSFTDQALFYAIKRKLPVEPSDKEFNTFFACKFIWGVRVIENNSRETNIKNINAILKANGLPSSEW